jgi:hypothetical protein
MMALCHTHFTQRLEHDTSRHDEYLVQSKTQPEMYIKIQFSTHMFINFHYCIITSRPLPRLPLSKAPPDPAVPPS